MLTLSMDISHPVLFSKLAEIPPTKNNCEYRPSLQQTDVQRQLQTQLVQVSCLEAALIFTINIIQSSEQEGIIPLK